MLGGRLCWQWTSSLTGRPFPRAVMHGPVEWHLKCPSAPKRQIKRDTTRRSLMNWWERHIFIIQRGGHWGWAHPFRRCGLAAVQSRLHLFFRRPRPLDGRRMSPGGAVAIHVFLLVANAYCWAVTSWVVMWVRGHSSKVQRLRCVSRNRLAPRSRQT